MSKAIFPILIVCLFGCYSPADEYILEHTEHDWYDDNESGFVIDFLMEESDDRENGVASSQEMLAASMAIYEESGSQHESLKSVTVWIAHTIDSWDKFNKISPDGSESYEDTVCVFFDSYDIDDFVVAVNPNFWRSNDKELFLRHYIHELVHYVSSQENGGDSDHNHENEDYWGDGGLLDRSVDRLINQKGVDNVKHD